jgi:hypothetical protein
MACFSWFIKGKLPVELENETVAKSGEAYRHNNKPLFDWMDFRMWKKGLPGR